jgi:hypothetical protein
VAIFLLPWGRRWREAPDEGSKIIDASKAEMLGADGGV